MKYRKDNIIIGANVKRFRKINKLTQKQLGELIGKTESSIQKYESGATEIPRSVLEKIAAVFELHILDLLDDGSAMEWLAKRDEFIYSLFKLFGCSIDYNLDNSDAIITYGDKKCKLPAPEIYSGLFEQVEESMLNLLTETMEKYSKTS